MCIHNIYNIYKSNFPRFIFYDYCVLFYNIINNILIIKIYNRLYKYFKYIYFRCIKKIKSFASIKYFNFSFLLNKIKIKFYFRKKLFIKNKNVNILFLINNFLYYLFLFLIKKWIDYNIVLLNNKFIEVFGLNFKSYKLYFFNKKIYNFLFLKYRILWQFLTKITYVKYFKPLHFIINYKKLNNF